MSLERLIQGKSYMHHERGGTTYSQNEWISVPRARKSYPCECGAKEHSIGQGDLYMLLTPTNGSRHAWGELSRRKFHVVHLTELGVNEVIDRSGSVLLVVSEISTPLHPPQSEPVPIVVELPEPDNIPF